MVEVARRHDLPVLVDAAAQLPPISNLRRFIEVGADLVAFSGGKSLRGPQSSGILCGRKDYIASVALQHLDTDEYFDIWDPPEDLIPKSRLIGMPRHGVGRGFKVSKENAIGLLTALKLFSRGGYSPDFDEQRGYLEYIVDGLSGLPVEPRIDVPDGDGYPMLHLAIDAQTLGKSGFDVSRQLKQGNPGVFVNEGSLSQDTLVVHPLNLDQPQTEVLTRQLRSALGGG